MALEYLATRWVLIAALIGAVALAATAAVSSATCAAVIVALVALDAATHRRAREPALRAAIVPSVNDRSRRP